MREKNISVRSLLSEVMRNILTGTSLLAPLALLLSLIMGAVGEMENRTVSALDRKAQAFIEVGASTFTVASEGNIDASACERLSGSGLVDRAGAIRQIRGVRIATLPGAAVSTYEVSTGFLEFLRVVPAARTGVLISEALARELLPAKGQPRPGALPNEVPPLWIIGTYAWPDDGRPTDLEYAVVASVPPAKAFDQCWIRSRDPADRPLDLLLSTLIQSPENPSDAVPVQSNPELGETFTYADDFGTRGTRYAWIFVGIATALAAMAGLRRRATELTNARECGIAPLALTIQVLLETFVWAILGAAMALGGLVVSMELQGIPNPTELLILDLRLAISAIVGAAIGSILGVLAITRRPTEFYLRIR